MSEEYSYKEDVSLFTKILSEEVDKLLSNENLVVVYIGRETCPYCRKFAKKLSGLVSEINTTIYYINSDNSSDNGLKSFDEVEHHYYDDSKHYWEENDENKK